MIGINNNTKKSFDIAVVVVTVLLSVITIECRKIHRLVATHTDGSPNTNKKMKETATNTKEKFLVAAAAVVDVVVALSRHPTTPTRYRPRVEPRGSRKRIATNDSHCLLVPTWQTRRTGKGANDEECSGCCCHRPSFHE